MSAYVHLSEEVPFAPSETSQWTKIGCSRNPLNDVLERTLHEAILETCNCLVSMNVRQSKRLTKLNPQHTNTYQKEWFILSWRNIAELVRRAGMATTSGAKFQTKALLRDCPVS